MSELDAPPPENGTLNGDIGSQERLAHGLTPNAALDSPPRRDLSTHIGRYEIRGLLGNGAFGRVFRGYHPDLGREVAIKVPHEEGLTPEFREAFLREARVCAGLHHPNVCPVHDAGTHGNLPYIVMRFVSGGTLAEVLKRERQTPQSAVSITRKLAMGLDAAHSHGIIHRDLKPANVLYDEANGEVLIADFGLARSVGQTNEASMGVVKGTPLYMPPEQALGRADQIGPGSDVYSLGIIFYEMLTGRVPFSGETQWMVLRDHCETPPQPPSAVCPGLDPRLDALCLKALEKKPADRYASAKDFAKALTDYLRDPKPDLPPAGGDLRAQAEAEYHRGTEHVLGNGVPQDYAKARACWERAAARGHAQAQFSLGLLHADGTGVPRDYAIARDWFLKAAAQDHAAAQYRLGALDQNGHGVARDYEGARGWYEKSAARGDTDAQYQLGVLHENGHVGAPNRATARMWYQRASAQHHPQALAALARLSAEDETSASATRKEDSRDEGKGTIPSAPGSDATANRGEADYQLGQRFFYGRGVGRSYTKARACFETAAAQGHAAAQFQLGVLSAHGQGGAVDWAKAREWYGKAAAQGHAEAQAYLAELYENGRGIAMDMSRAMELYRAAAAQGNGYAKRALKRLGEQK